MKVKFNKEQIIFLKSIVKDTELEKDISNFSDNTEIQIKEDLADDIRDICAQYEIDNAQECRDLSLDNKGKIAYELVNLLLN